MDRWRRCRFATWSYGPDGMGLLPEETEREGFVLALGATEPAAGDLLESFRARGFSVLGVPDAPADIALVNLALLWMKWGVPPAPRRGNVFPTRRRQYEVLRTHGLELPMTEAASHRDQLDAAAAAYAAYLWATGQARSEGARIVV
jgi:hypothetical protein